jgi:hypothetical protein
MTAAGSAAGSMFLETGYLPVIVVVDVVVGVVIVIASLPVDW